ncbi:MAG: hypothetical protein KDD78_04410, partial [Caldilineaceae bacterium]|nr:hypothetical protein [Caldilineaceae bacterium]
MPCLLLALLLLGTPHVARAETFVVNTTTDSEDITKGDGQCHDGLDTPVNNCSLRAAIQEANALAGADEIVLPAGIYLLTIPGLDEDAGAVGDLDITASEPLTITGSGRSVTIIDAGGSPDDGIDRVLDVAGGAGPVYLSDLTLRNGGESAYTVDGGGLRIGGEAAVTAVRMTVTQNSATGVGHGGGLFVGSGAYLELLESNVLTNTVEDGDFSAISNDGTIVIRDSTVAGNAGGGYNGAVGNFGSMTFDGSTYAYNGGPIHSWDSLNSVNSTFSSNDGDAIHLGGGSIATLSFTTIAANTGAGIFFDEGTTAYVDQVLLSGNGQNCAGAVSASGQFNLSDDASCTISGTNLTNVDGPIYDALLGSLQDNG